MERPAAGCHGSRARPSQHPAAEPAGRQREFEAQQRVARIEGRQRHMPDHPSPPFHSSDASTPSRPPVSSPPGPRADHRSTIRARLRYSRRTRRAARPGGLSAGGSPPPTTSRRSGSDRSPMASSLPRTIVPTRPRYHRRLRPPTTPQRPGRSTSGLGAVAVVVETTTRRGPLESIRQRPRIGSESGLPAQQREPDPTQPRMDRQRCRRPARPRPFPPPGSPITSPSERSRRRADSRGRFSAPAARAKPPFGRCTNFRCTTNLGVRYTDKAGTLHVLTSRKAAIFPVFQARQTLTSALRRAHAAPTAPRHFGPVSAAAAQRHGAPVATGAQRQPRQRPLVSTADRGEPAGHQERTRSTTGSPSTTCNFPRLKKYT